MSKKLGESKVNTLLQFPKNMARLQYVPKPNLVATSVMKCAPERLRLQKANKYTEVEHQYCTYGSR